MPECENCGTRHATVKPAEWVSYRILLCPACWGNIYELMNDD